MSIIKRMADIIRGNIILTIIIAAWTLLIVILPVNAVAKLFAIAAGFNFYAMTIYFGNVFNIGSLFMTLFLFMIGCSQAKLTDIEQNDFSLMTWLTLISVIVCFYVTIIVYQKVSKKRPKEAKEKIKYTFSARTVLIVNIVLLVAEMIIYYFAFSNLGGIPLFNDLLRSNDMSAVLSNYLMTIMVLPGMLIIFNIVYIVKSRKFFYFGFVILYIAMIMLLGGRINIFIPIVTSLFYLLLELHFKDHKRTKILVIGAMLAATVVLLMVSMPLLRTSVYSDSGAEYYDAIYDLPDDDPGMLAEEASIELPSFLKPVWVNLSTEMHGFDWMVKKLSETGEFQYGRMFLHGPFNFIFKRIIPTSNIDVLQYNWLNVLTFMETPYKDFGVFGVAVFIIAYTIAGMAAYNRALRKKSMFWMLFYAYYCMSTILFVAANLFMRTAYIVDTTLLLLFTWGFSIDWIQRIRSLPKQLLASIRNNKRG